MKQSSFLYCLSLEYLRKGKTTVVSFSKSPPTAKLLNKRYIKWLQYRQAYQANAIKIITILIRNMLETKPVIWNALKMSCQKRYFTMNIKLSGTCMHQISLYQNTENDICYKLRKMDRNTILMDVLLILLSLLVHDKNANQTLCNTSIDQIYFQS